MVNRYNTALTSPRDSMPIKSDDPTDQSEEAANGGGQTVQEQMDNIYNVNLLLVIGQVGRHDFPSYRGEG